MSKRNEKASDDKSDPPPPYKELDDKLTGGEVCADDVQSEYENGSEPEDYILSPSHDHDGYPVDWENEYNQKASKADGDKENNQKEHKCQSKRSKEARDHHNPSAGGNHTHIYNNQQLVVVQQIAATPLGVPKKCVTCGNTGHDSRDCAITNGFQTKKTAVAIEKTGHTCGICREPGHNRRRCPSEKPQKRRKRRRSRKITRTSNKVPQKNGTRASGNINSKSVGVKRGRGGERGLQTLVAEITKERTSKSKPITSISLKIEL
ncbi:hypothetical protein AA313_de0208971 [Arthrobotrys entomopaga]|nr:hypothetical protein AA313_de0208971 [Arthrobotrys entomopaga]